MPDLTTLPLVTINFSFSANPAVLMDFDYYWRSLTLATVGTLITQVDANATSLVVSAITKTVTTTISPNTPPLGLTQTTSSLISIASGTCLSLDGEPVTVTTISAPDANLNYTLGIVRGTTQATPTNGSISFPFAVPAPHAAGTAINVLQYFSPWELIKQVGLVPLAQKAVSARGTDSAIFKSVASGQLQVTTP
jgi:hypothetical protein